VIEGLHAERGGKIAARAKELGGSLKIVVEMPDGRTGRTDSAAVPSVQSKARKKATARKTARSVKRA